MHKASKKINTAMEKSLQDSVGRSTLGYRLIKRASTQLESGSETLEEGSLPCCQTGVSQTKQSSVGISGMASRN